MEDKKTTKEYLIVNLSRLRKNKTKVYKQRISLYFELMKGGNGGILPNGSEFRSLHFSGWNNKDFAELLVDLGELESIPQDLAEFRIEESIDEIDLPNNAELEIEVSEVDSEADVKKGWFSKLFGL